MATTESAPSSAKGLPITRRRKIMIGIAIAVIVLIAIIIANFGAIRGNASAGVSYASHIACSCRYIQGRDMKSCETDLEDGMGAISLSDDPDNKRVEASIPFLASEIAEKRGDFGCIILNKAERDALD